MTGVEISIALSAIAWVSRLAARDVADSTKITLEEVSVCETPKQCFATLVPVDFEDFGEGEGQDPTGDDGSGSENDQDPVAPGSDPVVPPGVPPPMPVSKVNFNTSNGGQAYQPTGDVDMDLYRY